MTSKKYDFYFYMKDDPGLKSPRRGTMTRDIFEKSLNSGSRRKFSISHGVPKPNNFPAPTHVIKDRRAKLRGIIHKILYFRRELIDNLYTGLILFQLIDMQHTNRIKKNVISYQNS